MRWLVTGSAGMLGTDLLEVLRERRPDDDVLGLSRQELDIVDAASVSTAVDGCDVVVNCAAWTDVDDAEVHEDHAFRVNALGAAVLAQASARTKASLVQVSTDYVFAGNANLPYSEDAAVGPRTAYGRTKMAGEWAVRAYLPERSWILRTAWLYGWSGKNFISTILRLATERDHVDVVDDQHGQPTWTVDLAHRIVDTVEASVPFGTYHATASGSTTWHGLAQSAVELVGLEPSRIFTTTSVAFARPAPRPAWSVLGHDRWSEVGLAPMRDWEVALADALSSARRGTDFPQ